MLNFPKTGSTFARKAIKGTHLQRLGVKNEKLLQFLLSNPRVNSKLLGFFFKRSGLIEFFAFSGIHNSASQHGLFSQIPNEFLDRELVSIARNPYQRFLSQFEFRAWLKSKKFDGFKDIVPDFPTITFEEFVIFSDFKTTKVLGYQPKADIGFQTIKFILMYFKNPEKVLSKISDEYIDSNKIFDDMANVQFLKQENLNNELADFLLSHGYRQEEVEYVRGSGRVNVSKSLGIDRSTLWTPKSLDYIKHKERLLFRVFEERGILYDAPKI